jgi:PAS domain S-box-containing protein
MSRPDTSKPIQEGFDECPSLFRLIESADTVAWITPQGSDELLYISPSAEALFGRTKADLMEDADWRTSAIHPEDLSKFKEQLSDLDPKQPSELLYRIRRPDGEIRWVEDSVSQLPSADSQVDVAAIGGLAVDVTDRVAEELRLQKVQSAFHALAETMPLSMIQKDLQGRIVFANKRYQDSSAQSMDQLLGKTNFELFPAELARKYAQDDQHLISTGQPLRDIEDHVNGDGSTSHIEVFKAPILGGDQEVVGFLVMFRDLTERKQAEEAFDNERFLLQTLLQNVPDHIYFKDRDSRFIRVSNSLAEAFGVDSPSHVLGKSDKDFFEEVASSQRANDELSLVNGDEEFIEKIESQNWSEEQGTTWVHTTKLPLRDSAGEVIGTFGISRNITDRKRVEADLERERDRLRTIINNVPDVIFVKDRYGRFVNGNEALRNALNVESLEEIIGKTDFEFWPVESACNFVADDQIVMRNNAPQVNHEESSTSVDGKQAWMLTSKVPLHDASGNVTGLVGISRDITKVKQVNEQLMAAIAVADAANKAKSDFLANMSHEIRTPMNAIIGMTELLVDMEMNATQREYLGMIQSSGEALLTVINDILDFSKIEAGKLELDPTAFDLRAALGDSIKSMATRAHSKSLEIAFRVQQDVPDVLYGDVGRFRQVVINLVGNAIKFTDAGEVLVDVGVSNSVGSTYTLVVKVRDTGIGIDKATQAKIFSEFQQADTSTTRRFGGTGLGLAISSRLVDLMGGRIWVNSQAGQGSEFAFTVKFERRNRESLKKTPVFIGGKRVLVVDDNQTNRRILGEMLTNWGMVPTLVESAQEALHELKQAIDRGEPFEIVLSDVHMPDVDGFMMAEQIRGNDAIRDLPIIMLTSGTRPGDVAARERLNIAIGMMKPVKQSELFSAVVGVLGVNAVEDDGGTVLETTPCRALDVLLVEDNSVNQKLAIAVLEKQGHSVAVASQGLKAVEMTAVHEYDLVLMDVQMPVMDGLDATRAIRDREATTGLHQIIVAMTAHAMKGDEAKCLEAGMNGYLAKPIRANEIAEKLATLFSESSELVGKPSKIEPSSEAEEVKSVETRADKSPASKIEAPDKKHVDWAKALANVGDDASLLRELIDVLYQDLPTMTANLGAAIKERNVKKLKASAHVFKGSMLFLNTKEPYQNLFKLEQVEGQDSFDDCEIVFEILKRDVKSLSEELAWYLKATPAQ